MVKIEVIDIIEWTYVPFKGTLTDEYFESQSKSKFKENYDSFKYQFKYNINTKAFYKSKTNYCFLIINCFNI